MPYSCDARLVDYDSDGDLTIAIAGCLDQRLYTNRANNDRCLKVHVIGLGEKGTNAAGFGVRADVMSANVNGSGPFRLHVGGLTPTSAYLVRAPFGLRTVEQRVMPTFTSSLFGARSVQ
ncbi:MAG: hypothetical protein DYG94_01540 [Leptolyngbya sp. PLA3]|nr:MAG: hypothetical protein EDM82_00345 [Cyanobacteria bacterium CYA]MCE7967414.1 hypothetical protein [Leptolyngbya sp. PL-A3]